MLSSSYDKTVKCHDFTTGELLYEVVDLKALWALLYIKTDLIATG